MVGLILERLSGCTRDEVKKEKIEYIRKSVHDVAVEVNITFPLDYFDPSVLYKALGYVLFGVSVAGFIYYYYKRLHCV